jgi:hypothetical protein
MQMKTKGVGKLNEIVKFNKVNWRNRILVSTATEGWVRLEWAQARYGQVIPVNWSAQGFDLNYTVFGYSIDDAYNLITKKALELGVDWLVIIEDDVLMPPDVLIKFGRYMDKGDEPVVSGLYYTKSEPSEPLLFRGRGNGAFHNWNMGQKVTVDGLPMGCLLLHTSILKWIWEHSDTYQAHDGTVLNRAFETPRRVSFDPQLGVNRHEGTQDLFFFDRVIENDVLKKCGFKKAARRKWPFLCDTSIFCQHIDRQTGRQYPGPITKDKQDANSNKN